MSVPFNKEKALEIFNFFDRDGEGIINKADISLAIRALGGNPTVHDENNYPDKMSLDDFYKFVEKKLKEIPQAVKEITEAFKVLDQKGKGKIKKADLLHILKTLGKPLNEDELEEFDKQMGAEKEFDYTTWVKHIYK